MSKSTTSAIINKGANTILNNITFTDNDKNTIQNSGSVTVSNSIFNDISTASLTATKESINYGDNINLGIKLFDGSNLEKTLKLYVNNVFLCNVTVPATGSKSLPLSGYKAGTYVFSLLNTDTNGNRYNFTAQTTTVTVNKYDSSVVVKVNDTKVQKQIHIEVTGLSDMTGNVTFTINGSNNNYSPIILGNGGKGSVDVSSLKAGKYQINVQYNGNDKYKTSTGSTTFEVTKYDTTTALTIDTTQYGSVLYVNAKVTSAGCPLSVNGQILFNGTDYITVSGGSGQLSISKALNVGSYVVTHTKNNYKEV